MPSIWESIFGQQGWGQQRNIEPHQLFMQLGNQFSGTAAGMNKWAGPTMDTGMANLLQILQSQGATDPGLMNRQLRGIERDTMANQMNIQAALARGGLGASGMGQALAASAGQAGAEQKASARDVEAQRQEERKRQDLALLLSLIINPQMGLGQIWSGLEGGYAANEAAKYGAKQQKKGALFGGLGEAAGAAATAALMFCWAAEEIFHNAQDEDAVRSYMAINPGLLDAYLVAGKNLAFEIKHDPDMRRLVTPYFYNMADAGYRLIG